MLSSPRRPSSTMRIFSSAERCRRVALRISRTVFSALSGMRLLACLIVAPQRYDEPAILSYAISSFCPTSANGLQQRTTCLRLSWFVSLHDTCWLPEPGRQPAPESTARILSRASGDLNCTKGKVGPYVSVGVEQHRPNRYPRGPSCAASRRRSPADYR